jgi:hypothetical protein
MPVTASRIFEYLEGKHTLSITRHEVACIPFAELRHAMYALVVGLREEDSGDPELSDRLRMTLSEWLTVPIPFGSLGVASLDELGTPDFFGVRWGAEMRRSLENARRSIEVVRGMVSPLRRQLGEVMLDATRRGLNWRIYSHRSAIHHFISCASDADCNVEKDLFIHSLRDYRLAEPFDLLIKAGPLRARGWAAFPSACLNAPRYRELAEVVWAGMGDELGFGEDPLIAQWARGDGRRGRVEGGLPALSAGDSADSQVAVQSWSTTVVHHPDTSSETTVSIPDDRAVDELRAFANLARVQTPRRAMLVHVENGLGLFYPRNAEVLLLRSGLARPESVTRCVLSDIDPRGQFLVRADIGDVDVGGRISEHGWYSTRWKAELKRQLEWHAEGLLRQLQAAGIKLRNLRWCVEHWIQPASSVIRAPQSRKHFELLVDVLKMESCAPQPDSHGRRTSWWRAAWEEIAASRGLAIQFGMQEQEIIGDEIDRIVLSILPKVQEQAQEGKPFRIAIPEGHSLSGSITFLRIHEVEDGFSVPESLLKTVIPVSKADEWRA